MTTRARVSLALLVVGAVLLVAGIVLGLESAAQFREFVQAGLNYNDSPCVPRPGHPGRSATLAWAGPGCTATSAVVAVLALLTDRRAATATGAITLGAMGLVATYLNWSLAHTIATCAVSVHNT
jgi:divalent metal cation (Fe/Co/Zn/Cd) transporter